MKVAVWHFQFIVQKILASLLEDKVEQTREEKIAIARSIMQQATKCKLTVDMGSNIGYLPLITYRRNNMENNKHLTSLTMQKKQKAHNKRAKWDSLSNIGQVNLAIN